MPGSVVRRFEARPAALRATPPPPHAGQAWVLLAVAPMRGDIFIVLFMEETSGAIPLQELLGDQSVDSVTVKNPLAVTPCAHYGEREDVPINFANLDIWKYRSRFIVLINGFQPSLHAFVPSFQKYNSISCFWETQPLGCIRISCVFHHRKPRNINGLFLPPSSDSTMQREVQEGILHPAPNQDPTKGQESTLRPIHPPLIITINLEDEDEEEQEEKYASYLLSKTPEDIEEEKAIKEVCYKSGEYYRIQTSQENSFTKNVPSVLDSELLKPMETGRDLQEGKDWSSDGVAVPSKFNIIERHTKIAASLDGNSRTDHSAFENGATSHAEGIKKHHFKGVKKKKWISEEPKNLSTPLTVKAMHTSNPKGKANFHQNDQSKNAENAAYVPSQRANGRSISLSSPTAGRSSNLPYGKVAAPKESKMNLPTERCTSAYNAPAWRKRSPHAKVYTKAEKMLSAEEDAVKGIDAMFSSQPAKPRFEKFQLLHPQICEADTRESEWLFEPNADLSEGEDVNFRK
ncbi:hypothetical protein lerEdw1_020823 [Lerista edwardsae]|nr:hypothetical protein lerEdw1_020823 [Lerista edwardsae]